MRLYQTRPRYLGITVDNVCVAWGLCVLARNCRAAMVVWSRSAACMCAVEESCSVLCHGTWDSLDTPRHISNPSSDLPGMLKYPFLIISFFFKYHDRLPLFYLHLSRVVLQAM